MKLEEIAQAVQAAKDHAEAMLQSFRSAVAVDEQALMDHIAHLEHLATHLFSVSVIADAAPQQPVQGLDQQAAG